MLILMKKPHVCLGTEDNVKTQLTSMRSLAAAAMAGPTIAWSMRFVGAGTTVTIWVGMAVMRSSSLAAITGMAGLTTTWSS
ncbi:Os12g0148400 [Oryza sativa Japonica Group]|uniref:Os12g0148400 protein n=2 Tax=Oryza TaxID=4527 RepID=Q0IQ40_ORYSJ|nr:Os12g0148400 [Oryza sativa Japonica Group]|eukprot:NP_001066156.1 Os12g0148400 [Oryza sativa Japonica Group]